MTWLLHFSASSEVDELFMSSVLFIVIGASLLASFFGFTYSLGAFVAGMIIAETKFYHKVETDIAAFKDILLSTFFIIIGTKIDVLFFLDNIEIIISIFIITLLIKTIIIYLLLRLTSTHSASLKTALALSQVGEFSFVIFAVASSGGLLEKDLESLLLLVVIFSMMVTPFLITRINKIVDYFTKEEYLAPDISEFSSRENHVIICGYSIIGKVVVQNLDALDIEYVIIDNSPKRVQQAINSGKEAYLGDMSKLNMLEALHTVSCAAVIVTLDNIDNKLKVCDAILKYTKDIQLIVKASRLKDKQILKDKGITGIVDGKVEVARILVEKMMTCQLKDH
jgi:CPA2 family monovalent cation:H+ antiporter-2